MNLLVTGAARPTETQLDSLRAMGHTVWFLQNEHEALPLPTEEVEGVVANGLFLHHDITRFTALRYIQLTAAGLDRVPVDHVRAHNITLHNAAGVYSIPMAEFATAAVLCLYKQLTFFRTAQTAHRWDKHRGLRELFGKRVCIVGCGNVGTACAKRFAALGCTVCGVDLFERKDVAYSVMHPLADLHAALAAADIVVLTVPLTEDTRHLIGEKELALLQDEAVLVNIARGAVVDTAALASAVSVRPLYAVLDVFEEEPLSPDSPLWDNERVLITPHNSFVGEHNGERLWMLIQNNLSNYMQRKDTI
ncbi:MAG: hydroxyacid dehydrogenase [Ruminococcaceae bacterium]|nr:hydroxyacid dehydrogenase [Oscillospiraceae bacterium]